MKAIKKLGICMDHAHANLIEFSDEVKTKITISLDFDNQDKDYSVQRNESEMHNKQQQKQHAYYKKLSVIIKEFTTVVLFGPTNAKSELFNYLRLNHQFDSINIEVTNTDKITDNQQHKFVREYFKKFDPITL